MNSTFLEECRVICRSYFDCQQEYHRFSRVQRELKDEDWNNYWGLIRLGRGNAEALVEFEAAEGGGDTSVGRPGVTTRGRETGAKDILVVIFLLIYYDKARLKFHLSKIVPCRTAGASAVGPESEAKTCFESQ